MGVAHKGLGCLGPRIPGLRRLRELASIDSLAISAAMRGWNDWYHFNGNTYGTWLRGDPRGWRARGHREHVVGDYKHPPPPGKYDALLARSKRLMKRPQVKLSAKACDLACRAMLRSLRHNQVEVVALSVDDHHFHVLLRLPQQAPHESVVGGVRRCVGAAKKNSARVLSNAGLVSRGGVWATRFRCLAIRDRSHQVNVAKYIAAHRERGAAVWLVWEHKCSQLQARGTKPRDTRARGMQSPGGPV